MCDRQVYELTAADLEMHGVWYFPMDETVENELTVRPVRSKEVVELGFQVIVRAWFETCDGKRCIGYIYWRGSDFIGHLQPVMFFGSEGCISFWSGVLEPQWENYPSALRCVRSHFPVSFLSETVFDLAAVSGVLYGLYSLKDGRLEVLE